jgi:hypothetical protein
MVRDGADAAINDFLHFAGLESLLFGQPRG